MGISSINPVLMSFYRDQTANATASQTFAEVANLVPSASYAISVRAFTSAGAGKYSTMLTDDTNEDSESCVTCTVSLRILKLTSVKP